MKKWEFYLSMYEQGMTIREIADKCGCSYQNVAGALAGHKTTRFREITPKQCAFPALRNWLNENRVSISELLRRIYGHNMNGNGRYRWDCVLKGHLELKKREIDALIRVTGMTYEELFGGSE